MSLAAVCVARRLIQVGNPACPIVPKGHRAERIEHSEVRVHRTSPRRLCQPRIWIVASVVLWLQLAMTALAQVPIPTLEGPVAGGAGTPTIISTTFDPAQIGYTEEEFFTSGTATAYTSADPLGTDGTWTATPASTAAYKTRIVVYRPTAGTKFKGTVVVEWLNVTGSSGRATEWINVHTEMVREGMAWVGVSAQVAGVEGSTGIKAQDPARYGSLVHPGDSFSYDIFSQAGQAIRSPAGASPLGTLKVKRLLAGGHSQSADRLTTYINAIDPLARVYDGFLVHSRSGVPPALSQPPQAAIPAPVGTLIRSDVRVPVLAFETETDLIYLVYFLARQPDSEHFHLWEVAGTSHFDAYAALVGLGDLGTDPAVAELVVTPLYCDTPINSGPSHFVVNAAYAALNRWVRRGKPPAEAPRLEVTAGPPPAITRDANGNAVGGIRTPQVDVPIAALSGLGQTGPDFCSLDGTVAPFDASTLSSLYPDHHAYVSAFTKATRKATRARYIRRRDAKLMKSNARASNIGS